MIVKVRCCGLGPNSFAADGSHIGETAVRNYLESENYKLSISGNTTLGFLSHRGRSIECLPGSIGNPAMLKKCIGKDDAGLIVGEGIPTFTHYVKRFFIEDVPGNGPFLCAEVKILDEDGFDDYAVQNIRRLKGLLKTTKLPCSLVVVAYWDSQNGRDEAVKIQSIKSLDFTINPSFGPMARVYEVIEEDSDKEKTFSATDENGVTVKMFSDFTEFGCEDLPKTSKIDGKFAKLMIKEYTMNSEIKIEEKDFSVATLKERVRFAKLSPRMRFRKLFLDYKMATKSLGGSEKIDPETLKTMKSLFATDCLDILKTITPEIQAGKPINTLIGASSLGKGVRVAAQKLMMPFKFALVEVSKRGVISPQRYKAIQAAYSEFIAAMTEEVFGPNPIPEGLEEEINEEEGK
jgi:hypothetical protein